MREVLVSATIASQGLTETKQMPVTTVFEHLANLPSESSIAALTTPERVAGVPDHLQIKDFHARGRNDVWHGRIDELDRLHRAYPARSQKLESTNHQIMAVYGAQGAGKSALLKQFEREAMADGIAVLGIPFTALLSEQNFLDQLTRTKLWHQATTWQRMAAKSADFGKRLAESTIGTGITSLATGGFGVSVQLVREAQAMDRTRPASVQQALQRLDNAFERGFVFHVDECQRLAKHTNNTEVTRIANLIGDPSDRDNANIRTGGLIVAGLADTPSILDALDITRYDCMRLGAMEPDDAMATLQDHVRSAEIEPEISKRLEGRWTEALAQDFLVWPHHTVCAARAAVRTLLDISYEWNKDPDTEVTWHDYEDVLEHTRTLAAQGVRTLYEQRLSASHGHPDNEIAANLAELAAHTENRFGAGVVDELIRQHAGEGVTDEEIAKHRQGLVHSGVLEPVLNEYHALTDDMRIPIPSMLRFICDTRGHQVIPEWVTLAQAGAETPAEKYRRERDEGKDAPDD